MSIVQNILNRLTAKAVEKYSDGWDENTTWLVIACVAVTMGVLTLKKRNPATTNIPPWNDDDTRDAVLDGMEDDELQAELDRRRNIAAMGNVPAVRPS